MKTFVFNGWAASERAWDLCRFHRERVFGYVEQLDGERRRVNRAYVVFVALDAFDQPVPVPPFEPETDAEQREYEAALERRKIRLGR